MQPTDPTRQPPPPQYGAPYAPPPQPAQPGGKPPRRLTPGDGLAALGGLLVFAFSFAPFVEYDDAFQSRLTPDNLPTWFSAWSTETFMGPLTWFVVLAGMITIGLAATHLVWPRARDLLGFKLGHVQIGVALFALLVMFGYATSAKDVIFGHDLNVSLGQALLRGSLSLSFSWGGYLMLFGTVLAAVGAILSYLEIGPVLYPQPPKRPGWPAQPAGYSQQPGYPAAPPFQPAPPQPAPPQQAQQAPAAPYPPPTYPAAPDQPTAQFPAMPNQQAQQGQQAQPNQQTQQNQQVQHGQQAQQNQPAQSSQPGQPAEGPSTEWRADQ
jgi:hypothetical protein